MIEIDSGFWIDPFAVTAIKEGADRDHSVVFLTGQSALEGFVVERDTVDLVEEVEDGRREERLREREQDAHDEAEEPPEPAETSEED